MHRPIPSTAVELTCVYNAEKANTRRDNWAVHRVTVVDPGSVFAQGAGLREGEEIEASGESEPYEFGSGEVDPNTTFRTGCEYRLLGTLHEGKEWRGKKTPVFKFKTFVRCTPVSKQAVLRYLQEAPNIGSKTAIALYEAFGPSAVRTLREDPARATLVYLSGNRRALTLPQAEEAAAKLRQMAALESTTMELMDLLAGYGLPKATAKRAIQRWGNRAGEVIRRNPLGTLMTFRGCGFLKADKVYQAQQLPLDALKRMTLCAWHFLSADANGHTWFPRSKALDFIRQNVGGVSRSPLLPQAEKKRPTQQRVVKESPADRAIRAGIRSGLLAEYTDDGGRSWLAEGVKAREERRLADLVLAAMDEPNPWEVVLASGELEAALAPLEPYQRNALLRVLHGGTIGILGGGPGSGKTFTAAALMKLLVATFGANAIAATAFTGKAARRFTEGMAAYKIPVTAVTTHSLLKVKNFNDSSEADDDGERSEFEYCRSNPLPAKLIVVDEVSMDDVPLLLAILEARPRGCGVLLVGDVNQLPPIGHGAPLRDLIASAIPYGELTEIRRNAGQVVKVCKKLRDKQPINQRVDFTALDRLDLFAADPTNCAFVPAAAGVQSNAKIIETLKFARDKFGFDPVWDCQVIVATNKKRAELNDVLQREFNPTADVVDGCRFRVGDKAIQLKNMNYKLVDVIDGAFVEIPDGIARVANGEFAKILSIDSKRIIALFSTPDRRVSIPRVKEFAKGLREEGKSAGDRGNGPIDSTTEAASTTDDTKSPPLAFDLGLAVTCHKMQGSQAKCVVVALEAAYGQACEWFLTALSRMEKACIVVGEWSVVQKMVARKSIGDRKTHLVEAIEAGRLFGERVWWVEQNNDVAST